MRNAFLGGAVYASAWTEKLSEGSDRRPAQKNYGGGFRSLIPLW